MNAGLERFHPGRLWSLLDMLKILALDYLRLGARIQDAENIFEFLKPQDELACEARRDLFDVLADIHDICKKLDMPVSRKMFAEARRQPPETTRELRIMTRALYGELESKVFMFIPSHRMQYFDPLIEDAVRQAFPKAASELESSGKTLAAGFYTASVFHAMRAAEIGVRALGYELGVAFPDKPLELAEWQNILDQADSKIVEMKKLPRGTQKDDKLNFYSQAAVQFRYFKDAWRVRVAHARETYDEPQALMIFTHTNEFFATLATDLKESDA